MFKNFNPSFLGIAGHQSEIIELALTYGFAGMDFNVTDFATRAKLKGMPYARRLIDSAQIKLGTFPLPLEWETDDETFQKDLKKLPDLAKVAIEVGCTRCVATLSPAGDKLPYHENFEFHRRRFQEICKALEPSGVRLGLAFQAAEYLRKNHAFQFVHDLDALTLLLNMVAAPNIGLLLDIWNVVASGGSLDTIQKLPISQIVAVQVADMPAGVPLGDLDEKSRLLPGSENGRIDNVGFLTILKNAGYDGPVTLKPSRGVMQSRRREMLAKQAGDALEKVWKAAGLISVRRFVPSAGDYDGET
jgi:sugar phosphate isomerase/epimerase